MLRILSAWNTTTGSVIDAAIHAAVETARAGGIIAFPTDTLFGMAVDGRNPLAVQTVFQVKRRPLDKPLPLLLADAAGVGEVSQGEHLSPAVRRLMNRYWPGALTILLPARQGLVEGTHGGGNVAVRVPNHPVALAVLRGFGGPLATTSANISGIVGARNPDEVAESIGEGIDVLLIGGPLATTSANISGIEGARNPDEVAESIGEGIDILLIGGPPLRELASSIIDMTVDPPALVRAGAIPWDALIATVRDEV